MSAATQSYRRHDRSLRLTFRFEGDDIAFVDRHEVAMVAPPSEDLGRKLAPKWSGFWMELQTDERRTVYRRVIRHPIRANAEVALKDGSFTNRVSVAQRGTFALVVPDLAEAADLALFSSSIERPHIPEPASELVRVPLRERRPRRPDRDEPRRDEDSRDGTKPTGFDTD